MIIADAAGCTCDCHRTPGVKHMVACCSAPPFADVDHYHVWSQIIREDGWNWCRCTICGDASWVVVEKETT